MFICSITLYHVPLSPPPSPDTYTHPGLWARQPLTSVGDLGMDVSLCVVISYRMYAMSSSVIHDGDDNIGFSITL